MFKEIFHMSAKNLTSNKLRTALSILGILIGIASIIALLTIGQGVSSSVTDQLSGLGGNYISVAITNASVKAGFTEGDLAKFSEIDHVKAVSPTLTARFPVSTYSDQSSQTGGVDLTNIRVSGTSSHYFEMQDKGFIGAGRALNEHDINDNTYVCVLGSDIASQLFGNKYPEDATILINGCSFTVVGILADQGEISVGTSPNKIVYIPYTTAMSCNAINSSYAMRYMLALEILVDESDNVEKVYDSVDDLMLSLMNGNSDNYQLTNQKAVMDMVVTITDLILGMLGGIAAISLLVGGIGIMNMMLVSVRERTAEIGLRKALGAKPIYIMLQFVCEAIMISLLGGIIGVGAGIAIAYVGTKIIGANFAIKASTILLAAGFSVAVGLIFGITPAYKASKLNPIDALRSN